MSVKTMNNEEFAKYMKTRELELRAIEMEEIEQLHIKQLERRADDMAEILGEILEENSEHECSCGCCDCDCEDDEKEYCTFDIDMESMTKEEAIAYATEVISDFYDEASSECECSCECPNCSGAMKAPEDKSFSFGYTYVNDNGKEYFIWK